MAYKIAQFRYYGANDDKNYWPGVSEKTGNEEAQDKLNSFGRHLREGTAFKDFVPIHKIGIQTFPGAMFVFNNNNYPIIVGSTGIFELELDDNIKLSDIKVLDSTLSKIKQENNLFLIIDLIYSGGNS